MNDGDRATAGDQREYVRFLTGNEAYIREVLVDGAAVYGIHAPDGRLLGVAPDRDIACRAGPRYRVRRRPPPRAGAWVRPEGRRSPTDSVRHAACPMPRIAAARRSYPFGWTAPRRP